MNVVVMQGASRTPVPPGSALRLLHRWFFEYNPLYLVSAALVLGGCLAWSQGLSEKDSLVGSLGIALVAEAYAASLIGGAALLTRVGLRRPAIMMALLLLVYQWDSTLHTETCAYLGAAGTWAAAAWFALFVAKMHALARALRVTFSRGAQAAAILGALGLAIFPRVLSGLGAHAAGIAIAVWLFALGALHCDAAIASAEPLDAWGETVLRRATRAAWIVSAALVGAHVLFWGRDHSLGLAAALPVVPLLWARRVRSETRTWMIVLGTLLVVAWAMPGAMAPTCALAASALCLRALSPRFRAAPDSPEAPVPPQPYRAGFAPPPDPVAAPLLRYAIVSRSERARSLAGALFSLYLGTWTLRWSGGPWPAHGIVLDLVFAAALLAVACKTRVKSTLLPIAASAMHAVVVGRVLPSPRSPAEWGITAVTLGFVLLALSLATSYRQSMRSRSG